MDIISLTRAMDIADDITRGSDGRFMARVDYRNAPQGFYTIQIRDSTSGRRMCLRVDPASFAVPILHALVSLFSRERSLS